MPINPNNIPLGEYKFCRYHNVYWVMTLRGPIHCDTRKEAEEEARDTQASIDSN